jgi:hypothetical protein
MVEKRIYKEALGIRVGDVITKERHGTGPYYVWAIKGPVRFSRALDVIIYPWPIVSLVLVFTEDHHLYREGLRSDYRFSYINEVYREGDRWFTVMGDEVFVKPPRMGYPDLPVDMFKSCPPDPEPYPFQEGVDYDKGHRQVWHCEKCRTDFNTDDPVRPGLDCPACGRWTSTKIIMAKAGVSTYVQVIN